MDPIIAVYNIKVTVRSSAIPNVGLTNDEIGEAAANGISDAIASNIDTSESDVDLDVALTVNATTVERTDD